MITNVLLAGMNTSVIGSSENRVRLALNAEPRRFPEHLYAGKPLDLPDQYLDLRRRNDESNRNRHFKVSSIV